MNGGRGDEILTGGLGADTFKWNSGDLTNSDTIIDFKVATSTGTTGGDVLDVHDLLAGLGSGAILTAHYDSATNSTVIQVAGVSFPQQLNFSFS
jgi:Ca2+-binding RTX toxin-like protein